MRRALSWVSLVFCFAICGCAAQDEGPLCGPPDATDVRLSPELISCEEARGACDGQVVSIIQDTDLARAYDIVFVPDGFDNATRFHARVDSLVAEALADEGGLLARAPDLFNIHRVAVGFEEGEGGASFFGSCRRVDGLDGTSMLSSQVARVERAAALAPDVDVVVLLIDGVSGRANAPRGERSPFVRMRASDSASVLTHELGHALFFLGDEYVDVPDAHRLAGGQGRLRPNVSLSPDEHWDGLVEGAREGAERYGTGVYRPTDHCRMRDLDDSFCPVCSAHIDAWLASRRGVRRLPTTCSAFPEPGGTHLACWNPDGLDSLRYVGSDDQPPFSLIPCEGCPAPSYITMDFDESFTALFNRIAVRDVRGESIEVRLD